MTPRHLAPALLLTAALGLAACGTEEAPPSEPQTVTVTATPTAEVMDAPEQQELTKEQISKALPTVDEAPKNFKTDPGGFDATSESKRVADPEACLAVYMDTQAMRDFRKEHLSAAEGVRYTYASKQMLPPSISVAIWTFDDPYPADFFDTAGAAVGECSKFTSAASEGGSESTWTATSIPTPIMGDQSLGVRIGDPELDIAIDYLWVRSGHNLINVRMLSGFRQNNDTTLKEYAQGVLDDLA